jgi:SMODS and SLOG-associating 2TM effector domain 3/SMODS and SLOG-associating 2TM effector domain 1
VWAPTPGPSTTVGDRQMPPLFHTNDQWALARQRESFRATRTQLTLLLFATTAAMLADGLDSRPLSALAAVSYGATILMGILTSRRRARPQWQVHRAAAETLKSLAWQFMVHGGPFHSRVPNPEALFAELLEERLSELRKVGWQDPRPVPEAMGAGQITQAMRDVRAKPFGARRDIYLRDRVLEQHTWYRNKAAQAHRASVGWSAVTAVLTLLALLTAVLRAFGVASGWDLTGLLATAAAATVAWQEMRRHRPLIYAHSLVKQNLETLRVAMDTTTTQEQWPETVAEAERLVSPQHTDWLARFGT